MRSVRYSMTAERNFHLMLGQGVAKFGFRVAEEKRRLLLDFVGSHLREFPHHGLRTGGKPFLHYPIRDTPFAVFYEYDDAELRVLFIVHKRQDRRKLDLDDVVW